MLPFRGSASSQVKVQGLPVTATQAEASASVWGAGGHSQAASWQLGAACAPPLPPQVALPTCLPSSPSGCLALPGRRAANLCPRVLPSQLPHRGTQAKENQRAVFVFEAGASRDSRKARLA